MNIDLMDVETAAQCLGISSHSLRRWTRKRCVPFVRMGRTIRFSRQALNSFILANAVKPANQVDARDTDE